MFCCISRIRTADSQILACSILPIDLTWIIYKSHKDTPSLVTPSAADEGKFTAATTSIGGKRRRSFEERIFLFISSILREFDLRLKSILFPVVSSLSWGGIRSAILESKTLPYYAGRYRVVHLVEDKLLLTLK